MTNGETQTVTGAFGFSGKYITRHLLARGVNVRTLTNSPQRQNPFGGQVPAFPLDFDHPQDLVRSLEGSSVLYNTYWVRFDHRGSTHALAVRNTLALISAARQAGVRRMVHVSITNPSLDSPLDYFRGKAELEQAVIQSGMSYAILRPAVLFGEGGILINNIAWMLRRFPIFGVFGDGTYRLQPIFVDDFARLAVEHGKSDDNLILDAIGPETFTYRQLVQTLGRIIGHPRPIVSIPDWLGYGVAWMVGRLMGDVVLTLPEIEGLKADLLCTDSPPAGETRLTEWATPHAQQLGRRYASELARRRDRLHAVEEL